MGRACLVLLGVLTLIASCKKQRLGEDERNAETVVILPQRLGAAGADTATAGFEIEEQTGRPKPTLVLRLDYFPTPQPGRTTLPSCFRSFPRDFALGEARCVVGDAAGKAVLFAKHVDQDCYTNPQARRIKASESLLMAGCQRAELYAYRFDPPVRIDTEVR